MKIIIITAVMLICELILGFIFALIAQEFYKKSEIDIKSIMKGFIERLFLTVFLFNNLPHALTFFSALKLATRLKHNEAPEHIEKFNNYYLIGNLISVTIALFYTYLWKHANDIDMAISRVFGN